MNSKAVALLLGLIVWGSTPLRAQEFEKYVFGGNPLGPQDSVFVEVKVVEIDPDEGRNISVYTVAYWSTTLYAFVGASYYQPERFFVSAEGGPNGLFLDGNVFFKNWLADTEISQAVQYRDDPTNPVSPRTRYAVAVPTKRRQSLGIHIGSETMRPNEGGLYNTTNISVGLVLLRAKHAHWVIRKQARKGTGTKEKPRQGTSLLRLHADVAAFIERDIPNLPPNTTRNDRIRPVVPRIYVDGEATNWGRFGVLSFNYELGVQIPYYVQENGYVFGGIGIGLSF